MDSEKLIEQANRFGMELRRDGGEFEYSIGEKFLNYATALSTLQAENARLREELEYEREHANAYHEECGQWEAENEKLRDKIEDARLEGYEKGLGEMSEENEKLRAELEQVKQELDAAISDLETIMAYGGGNLDTCQYCKNGQCYARGGTKLCLPQWRGQKKD